MKKILAMILVAVLTLGMAACGTINKTPVAVLWAEGDTALIPNSLINAMDRAMYIENISYQYYGAEGDQANQTAQTQEALNAGASLLLVELVDSTAAQSIVDLARAKDASVIFFGCDVDEAVVTSYEKCVLVATDEASVGTAVSQLVADFMKDNDKLDRNNDGQITYALAGELNLEVDASVVEYDALTMDAASAPDLIIAENDDIAMQILLNFQAQDYNTNKLVTHAVPIFTVGNEVDYKTYVLNGAPSDEEGRKAHFEAKKYLCDLTSVKEEDLEEMIYTTINVIDSGRITGTAIENYDAIAEAVAAMAASILKGEAVTEQVVKIPYTTYAG